MPVATSAADAKVMLEALEAGTDGVVLKTNNAAEVVCHDHSVQSCAGQCARRCAIQGQEAVVPSASFRVREVLVLALSGARSDSVAARKESRAGRTPRL